MVKAWTLFCSVILVMAAILFSPSLALGATVEIKTAGGDGGAINYWPGGGGGVGGGGGGDSGEANSGGGDGGLGGGGGGGNFGGGGGGGGGLGADGGGASGPGGDGINVGTGGNGGAGGDNGGGSGSGGSGLGGGGGGGDFVAGGGGGGGLGSGYGRGNGHGSAHGSGGTYTGSAETIGSGTGYSGGDTDSNGGGGGGGSAGLVIVGATSTLTETYTGGKGGNSGIDTGSGIGSGGGGGGGVGLVNYRGGDVVVKNSASITGGAGGFGITGGGGGAAVFMVGADWDFREEGSATGGRLTNSGTITGGSGGVSTTTSDGYYGGTGGHGIAANNAEIINSLKIFGGDGGAGGGGAGGGHGIDLFTATALESSITNSGTISGGNAGGLLAGATGNIDGSNGGDGITAGGKGITITNTDTGTISGGNGGANSGSGAIGEGGVGVRLENNLGTGFHLITSGMILGGRHGNDTGYANAVNISGNDNIVELRSGYSFVGNVAASGSRNILRLGGDTAASFDVTNIKSAGVTNDGEFIGFNLFEKTGNSDWTLTGTDAGTTIWTIKKGKLIGNADTFKANQVVESGATIVFDQSSGGTFANTISGEGGLTKTGSEILKLSNVNTYKGVTTITSGMLLLEGAGSIADSSLVSVGASGVFDITSLPPGTTVTIKALDGAGSIAFYEKTIAVGSGNTSTTFSGSFFSSSGGNLTKQGTGSLTLSGSNIYRGNTTIEAGEIIAKNVSALGDSAVSIQLRGKLTLDFTGTMNTTNTLTGTGNLKINDTLTISHANTGFTGTTTVVAGKSLKLDNADALAQSKLVFNNASLEIGQATTVDSVTADNGTINISDPVRTLSATSFTLTGSNIVNIDSATVGTHTLLSSTNNVTDWHTTVVNANNTVRSAQKETATTLQYKIAATGSMDLTWSGAESSNWNTTEANWLDYDSFAFAFANNDDVVFDNSAANKNVVVDSTGVSVGTMTVSGTDYTFGLTAGETPAITATGAIDLGGAKLNIVGYIPAVNSPHDGPENVQTLITSATSITNFTGAVTVAGQSTVDFLTAQAYQEGNDIKVETRLTWNSTDPNREAHGDFTVDSGTFTLGAKLEDNTSSNKRSDWEGDSLTKLGDGTLVLTAPNFYTGATIISSGVLALSGEGSIEESSGINVASGATFDISGITTNNATAIKELKGSGSVELGAKYLIVGSGDTSTTFSGVISGQDGGLTKQGTGTLTLSAANTYTGHTYVYVGTLALSGTGSVSDSYSVFVDDGAIFDISGISTASTSVKEIGGAGSIALGSKNLVLDSVGTSSDYYGIISGASGSLTKQGSSELTLSGVNTYTGATTVLAGSLTLSGSGSIAASSSLSVAAGATFNITDITTDSTTIKALDGSGSVTLGTKNLAIGSGNTSTTFSGVISGAGGSLTKEGSGIFTLSGANTYTGATTVSGGVLVLAGEAGNLAGSLAVNANATVEAANLSSSNVSFTDSAVANIGVYDVTTTDSILNLTNTIADNIRIDTLTLGAGRTLTVTGNGSYRFSTLKVGGAGATYGGNLAADNMTLHFDLPAVLAQGETLLKVDGDVNLATTTSLSLAGHNPLTMLAVDEEFTLIQATGILSDPVFNNTNVQDSYGNTYLLASSSTSLSATLTKAKSFEDIMNDLFSDAGLINQNLTAGAGYLDEVSTAARVGQVDPQIATAIGIAFDTAASSGGAAGSILASQAVQQFFGAYSGYATQALTDNVNRFNQHVLSRNQSFFDTRLFNSSLIATAGIASESGLASVRYGARDCVPVGQSRIWAGGFGTWAEQKERSNLSGYKYDSQGAILGYEYSLGSLNIGLAAAYSAGDFKIDDLRYKNETDVLNLALYGAYVHESGFFADGSLGYGHSWNDYEVDYIAVPGGVKKAKYGSDAFTANLDLGYIARLPRDFNLIPSVGIEYTYTRNDSWTENVNNAAIIANQFDSGHDGGVDIPLGLRFNKMFRFGHDGGVIIPEIRAAYVYSASKRSPSITSGFQGVNGVSGPSMTGVDPGRSHWRIGAGITGRINSRVDFRFGYDFETRSGFKGHNLNASVGLAF